MITLDDTRALVLFSGGQDSTTSLAWALARFGQVETVGFDYGQRHRVELDMRTAIRDRMARLRLGPVGSGARELGPDHLLPVEAIGRVAGSALTGEVEIAMGRDGLPTTFVPGRNLVFLTLAAALAYRRGCRHLVLGVCETDYSGYPDCRDDTMKAMQVALNLGLEARLVLHTPLMWRDKAATFGLAVALGGEPLLALVLEQTHTCYLGDRRHRHEWGYGCGTCPACELRAEGFRRWNAAGRPVPADTA